MRIILLIISLIWIYVKSGLSGKDRGAYKSTPDPKDLKYRLGNNNALYGNGWDDSKASYMAKLAGYDGQRKKLPENHLIRWGYGIELEDCQNNIKFGILDVVGYLSTPNNNHSSNATNNAELCYPDHLYEPIWLKNGSVNPNNYWANFVYQTVSWYKDYIKIWETWNEPDYTRNYGAVGNWSKNPPNPTDLVHWYGSIFQYIRLLRITYEVAKKVDPTCWVATGGLGYPEFVDAIMRYTDEPTSGKLTNDYPAYGGAYFDCDAYHQYPQYGVTDIETNKGYHDNGSDSLAKKVMILKKNHEFIIKKYGFGDDYPAKIFINTETGLNSEQKGSTIGGDLVRRNWILKSALYMLEYDVKQMHILNLNDDDGGMGDYHDLGAFKSYEEGFKKLKSSSKGRLVLKKIGLGNFVFDEDKTKSFRESMPVNMTGMVLKRKFPKEVNETHYHEYIYSAWLYCEKEEIMKEVKTKLKLPGDSLFIDWEGNEKNVEDDDEFTISSTPIFLLTNEEEMSGFAIFCVVVGVIIGVALLAIGGLYLYRKCIQKQNVSIDKDFFSHLLKGE